jgi:outer membrane lipoprotein SlyB
VSTYTVPAGTTFGVRLDEQLSTNSHRIGSAFTATLTDPILAPDGRVLIPAGATVRGEVIESRESGRSGEEARLAVAFTSISHAGKTYSIAGFATDTPVRLVTRDSRAEQAAKIGGGAAIGAVIGQVLGGNTRATVAGAAVGAAAGTAVAIGTADVDAVVDAGSLVTIRLDRGVTMEG